MNSSTQKTLKLTLCRQWFDLIKSGEKKEEYREIKPYWINRLCFAFDGCENQLNNKVCTVDVEMIDTVFDVIQK